MEGEGNSKELSALCDEEVNEDIRAHSCISLAEFKYYKPLSIILLAANHNGALQSIK